MNISTVTIGPELANPVVVGGQQPSIISGPCVIETPEHLREMAKLVTDYAQESGLPVIFKASYDKANRTSHRSFRGPGITEGLRILRSIREEFGVPVTTDVHQSSDVQMVADSVDLIQVPAFLCRQSDLVEACATCDTPTSIKKGQFLAPWDCKSLIDKFRNFGGKDLIIIERGTTFGYNNLVSDFRSLPILRSMGVPVIYDGTHSVQMPGGAGEKLQRQRPPGLSPHACSPCRWRRRPVPRNPQQSGGRPFRRPQRRPQ